MIGDLKTDGLKSVDAFKVIMLNPTKDNDQAWFMKDLTNDPRVDIDGQAEDQGNGVWKGTVTESMHPASFRIEVYTTTKARDIKKQLELGKDWKKMEEKGYMVDEKDFTNFEATIYFKVTKDSDDGDEMSIYGRGGRHPKGWFPENCVSCCYKGQIRTKKGESRWAKEYHHADSPKGYIFSDGTKGGQRWGNPKFEVGSIKDKWIGQKVVIYNIQKDGKKLPKMQIYCDTEGGEDITKQNWRLMNEFVDEGTLPIPEEDGYIEACNPSSPHQTFTWGGPYVAFRIDKVEVLVKNASVREIIPHSS
jgi:hypothetical protein